MYILHVCEALRTSAAFAPTITRPPPDTMSNSTESLFMYECLDPQICDVRGRAASCDSNVQVAVISSPRGKFASCQSSPPVSPMTGPLSEFSTKLPPPQPVFELVETSSSTWEFLLGEFDADDDGEDDLEEQGHPLEEELIYNFLTGGSHVPLLSPSHTPHVCLLSPLALPTCTACLLFPSLL